MPGIVNDKGTKLLPSLFVRDSNVYANTCSLDADLVAMANATLLADIPMEHLRGHVRLKKILRGTTWVITLRGGAPKFDPGQWANWFTHEDQCIVINIPLKMKRAYKAMSKATGDYLWSRKGGGSFWARDRAHRKSMTDLILPWAFRHEFGHSIDYLTQFMNRFGSRPEFGGWVAYKWEDGDSRTSRFKSLIQDVLAGVCRERRDLPRSLTDTKTYYVQSRKVVEPVFGDAPAKIAQFMTQEREYTGETHLAAIAKAIARIKDSRLRSHFERVWEVIAAAAKEPWLKGDLSSMYVIDGRVYSYYEGDESWFSFDARAYRRRVSNYQFASPSEWFAEYYSARYAAKTGPAMYATLRRYMDAKFVDEIDTILASDCRGTPPVMQPFRWSAVADDKLSAKQIDYIKRCSLSRRGGGTWRVTKCNACSDEHLAIFKRNVNRETLLKSGLLCQTCAQALRTADILNDEVQALCSKCSAAVGSSSGLKSAWTYLHTNTKSPVVVCSKDHWTPVPIDSMEGLIPCPWYDL